MHDDVEQSSWLLFLNYLDTLEANKNSEAQLARNPYEYILADRYRWKIWSAPKGQDHDPDALDTAIACIERETVLKRKHRTRLAADLMTGKLAVLEVTVHLPTDPLEVTETEESEL